jgi:hypothetical protein
MPHDLCSQFLEEYPAQVSERAQLDHQVESVACLRVFGELVPVFLGQAVQVVLDQGLVLGCGRRGLQGTCQQPVHVDEGVALRGALPVYYHYPLAT